MRNTKQLFTISLLLFSLVMTAQNYGLNNRNNNTPSELETERYKEDFEKQKAKNIEKSLEKLKNDLQLDALQEVAIKQVILESIKKEGIIIKKEEDEEAKMKALQALAESTDSKITAFLNAEQKVKFIELKDNLKKKKK